MKTINNNSLSIKDVGKEVVLHGWASKVRDLGHLCFIDLRDRSGIIQLSFKDDNKNLELAKTISRESVLEVKGIIEERSNKNKNILTGDIEAEVTELTILNRSKLIPFEIEGDKSVEETRLGFRYLDLRRETITNNLVLRHKVNLFIRNYLNEKGFLEIETPILSKSTPEGARDYLVPSRVYPGTFYALPQSPQIYKQLLMIGGMEKYFQIARCFRDEDLRSDRQPEFTQLDLEMSFVDEEDVFTTIEGLMTGLFKEIKDVKLKTPFPRMKYNDAIKDYGSDKPDLRYDMKILDLKDILKTSVIKDKYVNGLLLRSHADYYSRKQEDKIKEELRKNNLSFYTIKIKDGKFTSSLDKYMEESDKESLIKSLDMKDNDILFVSSCEDYELLKTNLGVLRKTLAKTHNLIKDEFKFVWITEFPMYEYSEEEKRYVPAHHPFTSPLVRDIDKLENDKENCYSRAYDLVLNGYELLSGSVRITNKELQSKVFKAIGLSEEEAKEKFGFFLEAFEYGAPPHAGVGIGLDRLIMILCNTENIKDVIAFPKTASARDLMSDSPSRVTKMQLDDVGIELKKD